MLTVPWALAATAATALAASGARAACECGYRDPATTELWTDAVITYFNETDAAHQIVFQPDEYADRYGRDDPGYAGTGQQAWIGSNRINEWEDDWSATWRSAVVANNTHLGANGSGLIMDVTPADTKNRISWGSQLQTRRRDMQYGSFRTMLNPPPGRYMAGTDFDIEVAWNQSELIRTAFFNTNNPGQGNVQVSFSSNSQSVTPFLFNQSTMNGGGINGLEYRMDWLPQSVSFTNTGSNTSSNARVWSGKNVQPPSRGAPFSYKHWSNGSPTQSRGPPLTSTLTAQVLYARLFFNSSRPERLGEFTSACASASGAPVCSTDDTALRGSTPFDLAATVKQTLPKHKRHVPVYSIYGTAISGGIFAFLTIHAAIRRTMNTRRKRAAFYEKYYSDKRDRDASTPATSQTALRISGQSTDHFEADQVDKQVFDDAMDKWEDPSRLLADRDELESVSSDSDDDDEKAAETWGYALQPDSESLFSGGTNTSGYVLPQVQLSRQDLNRSGLLTPMMASTSGASTPGSLKFPGARDLQSPLGSLPPGSARDLQTPPHTLHARAIPSVSTVQVYNNSIMATSVGSFGGEDGFGHPPAMPQMAPPTVVLEDGSQAPVAWVTPIADWSPMKGDGRSMAHGMLANTPAAIDAEDEENEEENEPKSVWGRIKATMFVTKGEGRATSSGAARVEYLDGLRGFACFLVSLHHFCLIYYYGFTTQPTGSGEHYKFEHWMYKILGPVLCNGGLNVGIFFVLSARVVCNRYLYRGNLQHLAQLIQTRVPRLGVTITAAIMINYFLIEVQAFYWTSKLASRTWSIWSYYEDFKNVGVFIDMFLSLWWMQSPSTTPFVTHYATGILWTVPVIVQCTWTCALCALIGREIRNPAKRYGFYSCCIVLSWWANHWDYFFLAGLLLADLDVRFQYRNKLGLGGPVLAWAFFAVGAVTTWLHYCNVLDVENEWGIHPNFTSGTPNRWVDSTQAWNMPKLNDAVFVISFFLLCDLCTPVRTFFQLRFWNVFGRNAFSLYLLHGVVFWSVGSAATLKMLAAGIPYWATQILNFLLCYAMLLVVCELFTRTFDRWGIKLSRAFFRAITGGLGRRPTP